MLICHHCGAPVAEEATGCPACGTPLTRVGAPDAGTGAGTSPLRIGLALLALAVFGLAFWTLVRNGTDYTTPGAVRRSVADAPARRSPARSSAAAVVEATPAPAANVHDDARRMTVAEARAAFEAGTAVMADVRSRDAYNTRHIKGALLLDEETLHGSLDHLPKDKLIITYCA